MGDTRQWRSYPGSEVVPSIPTSCTVYFSDYNLPGRTLFPDKLHRLFQRLQFTRTVNRYGFVSVQRFYIYAEQGLSRQRVSIWIYEGSLHIEYQDTLLTQYQADYDQKQKHFQIKQPTLEREFNKLCI